MSGRSLPRIALAALRAAVARPWVTVALVAVNLAVALVVVAPLRGPLAADLDTNLYGGAMASGTSWRWFDTFDRRHPALLGDLGAWEALFGEKGVTLEGLRKLSGVPAAAALGGLLVFWLNGLLHTGWLAVLRAARARPGPATGTAPPAGPRGVSGVFAAAVRYAVPATLLAALALALYAGVYAALYVGAGRLIDRLGELSQRETVSLALTWGRLLLTAAAMLGVKLLYDLARAALVELGGWSVVRALAAAAGELVRRGAAYVALYLLLGAAAPLLVALWWLLTAPLAPQSWVGLAILFVLQQLFLGARVGLRLAHLAGTQALFLERRTEPEPPAAAPLGAPAA